MTPRCSATVIRWKNTCHKYRVRTATSTHLKVCTQDRVLLSVLPRRTLTFLFLVASGQEDVLKVLSQDTAHQLCVEQLAAEVIKVFSQNRVQRLVLEVNKVFSRNRVQHRFLEVLKVLPQDRVQHLMLALMSMVSVSRALSPDRAQQRLCRSGQCGC